MKLIKIIFFFLVITNCFSQVEQHQNFSVFYDASTRGGFKKITYNKSKLILNSPKGKKEVVVSQEQQDKILELLKMIDLGAIHTLKAPSNRSTFDADLQAIFKVEIEGDVYKSSVFDDGNPPKELKPIIVYLDRLLI